MLRLLFRAACGITAVIFTLLWGTRLVCWLALEKDAGLLAFLTLLFVALITGALMVYTIERA